MVHYLVSFFGPFFGCKKPLNRPPVALRLFSISESRVPLPRRSAVLFCPSAANALCACVRLSKRVTHFCTELRVGHECKDVGNPIRVHSEPRVESVASFVTGNRLHSLNGTKYFRDDTNLSMSADACIINYSDWQNNKTSSCCFCWESSM